MDLSNFCMIIEDNMGHHLSIVSRGVGSPLHVGENLDSPPQFSPPPGSSKTKSPPQETFVISVPTNCQVGLTPTFWSENSSAYKLLKVSRVIYDFKIVSGVTFESISFSKLFLCHIFEFPPA